MTLLWLAIENLGRRIMEFGQSRRPALARTIVEETRDAWSYPAPASRAIEPGSPEVIA